MINNPTIGITGASGHIGSALAKHFTLRGFRVIEFLRNMDPEKSAGARKYDLTQKISAGLFSDIDILIHCAYVSREQDANAEQINVNGSKYLFDSCREQGVKKIIFFSTATAVANAKSGYARSKFAIEQFLDADKDFLIRCSLVIGKGGLFQRMLTYVTTHRLIPVIGAGNQVIQVVAVDDVLAFVEQVVVADLSGSVVLANRQHITYKQLLATIADVYQRKIVFVHVPPGFLKIILRVCRILNIRTAVSEENILGMQTLRTHDQTESFSSFRTLRSKLEEMRLLGYP
jgi:nucleoside-diphosphate-sugar epimerase